MMRLLLIVGGILGLALSAASYVAFGAEDVADRPGFLLYDDPATVAAGQVIYNESCAVCHGVNLEGDPNWRGRDENGLLNPPPHNDEGHTWHHDDGILFELTKFGTAAYVGSGYVSAMIGFEDILTDEEILATLAYIKSTWSEEILEINNEINATADLINE